jgi:hypothetical protein
MAMSDIPKILGEIDAMGLGSWLNQARDGLAGPINQARDGLAEINSWSRPPTMPASQWEHNQWTRLAEYAIKARQSNGDLRPPTIADGESLFAVAPIDLYVSLQGGGQWLASGAIYRYRGGVLEVYRYDIKKAPGQPSKYSCRSVAVDRSGTDWQKMAASTVTKGVVSMIPVPSLAKRLAHKAAGAALKYANQQDDAPIHGISNRIAESLDQNGGVGWTMLRQRFAQTRPPFAAAPGPFPGPLKRSLSTPL